MRVVVLLAIPLLVACGTTRARVGQSAPLIVFEGAVKKSAPGDIYSIRPDGSGLHDITASPTDEYDPAWSPDGRKIAFVDHLDVFVMDADGGHRTKLTENGIVAPGGISWSPDGRKIAVASIDGGLYPLDADGGGGHVLPNGPRNGYEPDWSPDGSRLVVSGNDGRRASRNRLYIVPLDGSPARPLAPTRLLESNPKWSPDGSLIAFEGTDDHRTNIYVIRADGTGLRQLTHRRIALGPEWSPTGTRIAFIVLPGYVVGAGEIFLMSADGTNERRITRSAHALPRMSWRPLPRRA
jgi:TolB protein